MKAAVGVKVHSGWAALVAVGADGAHLHVIERCRLELLDEAELPWAKQPYHAAQGLRPNEARELVRRAIAAAGAGAARRIKAVVERLSGLGHETVACSVLVGEPMPEWTVAEILAVHFRMHKAEGVLFQNALLHAAKACGLKQVPIKQKGLTEYAVSVLGTSVGSVTKEIARLGKSVGPPWGKDHKEAAMAALVGLRKD